MSAGFGGRGKDSLQENVEKLTGQRGNGLDKALTLRDLQSLGMVNVHRAQNGQYVPRPVPPLLPDDKPVERPHAPEGFSGFGGFGSILLEWKNPTYAGHAYTEVWRSTTDVLSKAVMIATTPATVFGDVVNPGSAFYYWARHVNVNNIAGPYHDAAGVKVVTSPNISDIIDDIGDQMESSVLIQGLKDDIAEGDRVLATQISESNNVLVDADKALAQKITSVESTMNSADNALSGRVSSLQQSTSSANQALSDRIDTTQSTLNGVSSTVQGHSQTIAEIQEDGSVAHQAMWNQKAQAGDIKAGIGILAKSDGTSQVAVSASQFFVFDPNTESPDIQPLFAIDKGNVIIPKALIESATIQILNAQTIVADEVKAGISISTPTLTSAVINGAEINIGAGGPYSSYHTRITDKGVIYTDHIVASGGSFNNVTIEKNCVVKGTLSGADGDFSGTVKANKIIGNLVSAKGVTLNIKTPNDYTYRVYHTTYWNANAVGMRRSINIPNFPVNGSVQIKVNGGVVQAVTGGHEKGQTAGGISVDVGTGSGHVQILAAGYSVNSGIAATEVNTSVLFILGGVTGDFK
ncbi:hypothetical protein [Enterovibrio sp. 27052020O]|uniref:phage tail tip fiber protein n=1 Tax=Enterovibrio sp. 27052020O TaxID=3241166 RepID=UPI003890BD8F